MVEKRKFRSTFYGVYLPKTFAGTMGQAEEDSAFGAGHMCSDIIEKQRCFREILSLKTPKI